MTESKATHSAPGSYYVGCRACETNVGVHHHSSSTPSPVLSAELTTELREVSNQIWNSGKSLTHNQIDEKLNTLIAQAVSEAVNDKLSSIEIELDKAYPKDGNIPKRSVLFLMANGKAEELLSERKESHE